MINDDLVKGFFAHRIIEVNTRTPFVLASGKTSPVYFDHRRIFSLPKLRDAVVHAWAVKLSDALAAQGISSGSEIVLAGTATAGIAPAYALAQAMGCAFVYVRSKPKGHGQGRMVEGAFDEVAHRPMVVVDDMVTTGGSLLESVRALRAEGAMLCLATSITRHDFAATRTRFAESSLNLVTLFTTHEIFDTASRLGLLGGDDLRVMMSWLEGEGQG